jgi:hypothetical protein
VFLRPTAGTGARGEAVTVAVAGPKRFPPWTRPSVTTALSSEGGSGVEGDGGLMLKPVERGGGTAWGRVDTFGEEAGEIGGCKAKSPSLPSSSPGYQHTPAQVVHPCVGEQQHNMSVDNSTRRLRF